MSWKSFVTAGMLCLLAAPVFAAPTIQVTHNGTNANAYLNADGNWVWQVRLSQSSPPVDLPDPDGAGPQPDPAAGSPLAAELGFNVSAITGIAHELISASVNAAEFDDPNPGNVIYGWETLTALGGTGACDSATPGSCPVGLQVEPAAGAGSDGSIDELFTAFGSIDYLSDTNGKDYVQIITRGPNTAAGALAPSVTVTGSYGTNQGRIAELNQAWDPTDNNPAISLNYDTFNNVFARSVIAGDADLSGDVDGADLSLLLANFFGSTTTQKWYNGNFDNQINGDIDGADLSILLSNFFVAPAPVGNSGGGGGGVPEPATLALVALAGLGLIGLRRRS